MRRHIVLLLLCLMPAVVWSQSWEVFEAIPGVVSVRGGVSNENGNYIVGNVTPENSGSVSTAFAMFVTDDGFYYFNYDYAESGKSDFYSALCLENGNAFIVGRKSSITTNQFYNTIWVVIVDENLNVVEEHSYPIEDPFFGIDYMTLTRNNDNDIIMVSQARKPATPGDASFDCLVCKFNDQGEMLDHKYVETTFFGKSEPRAVSVVPNTNNFMVMDSGFDKDGFNCISYMDENFDFYSHHSLLKGRWKSGWINSTVWLDETRFLMSAMVYDEHSDDDSYFAAVFESDLNIHFKDTLIYNRIDTADYTPFVRAMEYVDDSTIYFVSYEYNVNGYGNSVVVMLIDKDLNLLGSKKYIYKNGYFNIFHIQKTNDGGCLLYGKRSYLEQNAIYVKKVLREDLECNLSVVEVPDKEENVAAYPNPTSDYLNIPVEVAENQSVVLSVTDIEGRKIVERRLAVNGNSTIRLDVSSFNCGIYFYEILNVKNPIKGKFVKN